jgi:hypothetical protein
LITLWWLVVVVAACLAVAAEVLADLDLALLFL